MMRFPSLAPLSLLLVTSLSGWGPPTFAQGLDSEPNDTCPASQELGAIAIPFTLDGRLDSMPGAPDIDFFHLTATPGDRLSLVLDGVAANGDPIGDGRLGAFGSGCGLLAAAESFAEFPTRLTVTVPANGELVIAVTVSGDVNFLGGGVGDYRLQVGFFQAAGSIGGRLVDAVSGEPLPGEAPPFGFIELHRCNEIDCFDFVGFQSTDAAGRFHFEAEFDGDPLEAGTYQLTAFASRYEFLSFGPFTVGVNEDLDLGDLAMTPIALIGSIRGRLVDALDGSPLPGNGSPFSLVFIERCTDFGCSFDDLTEPDERGRFVFDGRQNFLRPGEYRLVGVVDQYEIGFTEIFAVGADEEVDLGDFALQPLRIQFTEIQPCVIPPQGGLCHYSAQIRHRGGERFDGVFWGLVEVSGDGSAFRGSTFQTGRLGTVNPMPEKLNLKAGEQASLDLQVDVPGDVPGGTLFCFFALVGEEPAPLFHLQTSRFLFCLQKEDTAFVAVPEKEARRKLREMKRIHP